MTVANKEQAFIEADKIIPTDYDYDAHSSSVAGYPIYRSTSIYYAYICDLGDRLEVNLPNGKSVNIWIEKTFEEKMQERGFHKNVIGVWVA